MMAWRVGRTGAPHPRELQRHLLRAGVAGFAPGCHRPDRARPGGPALGRPHLVAPYHRARWPGPGRASPGTGHSPARRWPRNLQLRALLGHRPRPLASSRARPPVGRGRGGTCQLPDGMGASQEVLDVVREGVEGNPLFLESGSTGWSKPGPWCASRHMVGVRKVGQSPRGAGTPRPAPGWTGSAHLVRRSPAPLGARHRACLACSQPSAARKRRDRRGSGTGHRRAL